MEPCRYWHTGGCARGSSCRFSHDDAPLDAVPCPYVHSAAGCIHGSRCHFSHGHPPDRRPAAAAPLPDLPSAEDLAPGFEEVASPRGLGGGGGGNGGVGGTAGPSAAVLAALAATADDEAAAAGLEWGGLRLVDDTPSMDRDVVGLDARPPAAQPWAAAVGGGGGGAADPWAAPGPASGLDADASPSDLCGQWAAAAACTRGERCHLVHGEWCELCERWALHPTDAGAAAAHAAACAAAADRAAALAASAGIECGICLEAPMSKSRLGDRRFGLLAGCDHAFCLACIRGWRAQSVAPGPALDVEGAVRTCPLCRTPSPFVTPSTVWPTSPEAKAAIIDGYKAALARTDCRMFAGGAGACPFGTSCLYRHAVNGRDVDRGAQLRWVGDEGGVVKPMASGVRLGDFLVLSGGNSGRGGSRRRG